MYLIALFSFVAIFIFNYFTPFLSDDYGYAAQARTARGLTDLIAQEYHQIDFILLNLRTDLLLSSEMARQVFVDIQIGGLLNEPAGRACRVKLVFAQNAPIGNAEILHQFLLGVVSN